MPQANRNILLPIETLNRELDGKLLLALVAAERGWRPVIGGRTVMHRHITSFPASLYFSKSIRAGTRAMYRILKGLGHRIVALDEEALVRMSDAVYLMKVDPFVAASTEIAMAWGEDDLAVYDRIPALDGRVKVATGNPRFDLMRPELSAYFADEVAAIRARYGSFCLFNSNFAMVNHFVPNQRRFRVPPGTAKAAAEGAKGGIFAYKSALFETFRALIPQLSRGLAPHNLVIRPHPSERAETWVEAARGLANVHVVHEASVIPWLTAAAVLVHNGCTSAVEAAMLGTPSLAYTAVSEKPFDLDLPNEVSREIADAGSLVGEARRLVEEAGSGTNLTSANHRTILRRHVVSIDGKLAAERIVDALASHLGDDVATATAAERVEALARHGVRVMSRAVRERRKGHRSSADYTAHKFPGLPQEEIDARIARFSRTLGRFDSLAARQIMLSLYAIEAAKSVQGAA